jgi:ABC-type oligopeptide transport system ATPase subunit
LGLTLDTGEKSRVDCDQRRKQRRSSTFAASRQYKTSDHLVTATHRVDFQCAPSDRFILLGLSGCGKSTR